MIRNLIGVFALVVVSLLGLGLYHLESVENMAVQPVPVYHWEDTSGTATVEQVIQANAFSVVPKRRFNAGYTESIHWFRFRLSADSLPKDLSFEIRNHTIDQLELFAVRNDTIASLGRTGNRFPFVQRPSPTKTFVFLLSVEPGERVDYYLRVDKRYENLATELTLWQTADFEDKEQREYFLWGIFVGVVGLVVLLAFLFYRATLDPVYSWYGLYILALTLRQFADTGLGFQYLWPGIPQINQPEPLIEALWLYLPAMLRFQQYFLDLKRQSIALFRISKALEYTYWMLFVGLVVAQITGFTETFTGGYKLVRVCHTVLTNTTFLVFAWIIVVGLRSADPVKQVYAGGIAIQNIGQLLVVAQHLASSQTDGFFFIEPYFILLINFFIDLVVFAYLLAYRYRKSLTEQQRLQVGLIQAQQQTNDAVIDVLESERQQVGKLLVNDVSGRLSQIRDLLAEVPPTTLLSNAVSLIDKSDDCIDQILRDGLPPDLIQKGLPAALAELIEQRNQTGTVHFAFDQTDTDQSDHTATDFSITQTRQLYRITNELINNIIKHANATEGRVALQQTAERWQLVVSDNGKGFDSAHAPMESGIGLKNLYARAQTLNATVQVQSDTAGTRVVVEH